MSAGVLRRVPSAPGARSSLLYFANSLGAAAGVLRRRLRAARLVGLPGTLLAAACVNLVVARRGARRRAQLAGARTTPRPAPSRPPVPTATPRRPRCPLVALAAHAAPRRGFGTAVASFIYEIAWIRMLSLVLGSATHSFELMLSAFILGLALGAFWIRRRADRVRRLRCARSALVQMVMGALALATLPVYLQSFHWMARFMAALRRNDRGLPRVHVARYVICLAVMLPATFCAGMTLPLITRMLLRGGSGERAIGAVYAVNTLGSIVGAALAALVLMPLLGLKWLLVAGAAVDMRARRCCCSARCRTRTSAAARGAGAAVAVAAAALIARRSARRRPLRPLGADERRVSLRARSRAAAA